MTRIKNNIAHVIKTAVRPPNLDEYEHIYLDELDSRYDEKSIRRSLAMLVSYMDFSDHRRGIEVTGISIRKKENYWLCIVNGRKKSAPMVLFMRGPTLPCALIHAGTSLLYGYAQWKPDKYVPK